MNRATAGEGLPAFSERLLRLLDEGRRTSTYKYALLLGLIDVCAENVEADGGPPASITATQLAPKIAEIYWHQTRAWTGQPVVSLESAAELRQNSSGQAEIIRRLRTFRERTVGDDPAPLHAAGARGKARFDRLLREIRWKLIEMPIPKLQVLDGIHEPFIYRIGWDSSVRASEANATDFDERLILQHDAGEHLLQMAPLLRPLIERSWSLTVARFNRLEETELEDYLFGARRISLSKLQLRLRELAGGRCFFCEGRVAGDGQVDHFIPWARHFDNGIENLVYAHAACNGSKSARLAAERHVRKWLPRFTDAQQVEALGEVAAGTNWERRPDRTLGIARSTYLRLPTTARLWESRGEPAVQVDLRTLRRVFAEVTAS